MKVISSVRTLSIAAIVALTAVLVFSSCSDNSGTPTTQSSGQAQTEGAADTTFPTKTVAEAKRVLRVK